MLTRKLCTVAATAACLSAPAVAEGKTRFTIRGAGFGHGVGMSQWGAYGFATHGWDYKQILAHYYSGTSLGTAPSGATVRVLLGIRERTAYFSGASTAAGKVVAPGKTYGVRATADGNVVLLSPTGRKLKKVAAPLSVGGAGGAVQLAGAGAYRGGLEFRPDGGGVQAVNVVGLEDYVRGVVSRESPSRWPAAALEAQAVAARTYAVTTSKGGNGFDQYQDTRSQVYGGIAAETPSTDAAVAATAGRLVTYQGRPAVTYFFSTSGGRTEDIENTALGTTPVPWLKSVDDPYDNASPKHRWGPYRWTLGTVASKLRGLVKGSFKGIKVVRRGESPRVVLADIVGSGGTTRVSGSTLRSRLGLFDTWVYFTSITTGKAPTPKPPPTPVGPTGGVTPEARSAALAHHRLTGQVIPAHRGSNVQIERRDGGKWTVVGNAETDSRGRFAFTADVPAVYRARFKGDPGPSVVIR